MKIVKLAKLLKIVRNENINANPVELVNPTGADDSANTV